MIRHVWSVLCSRSVIDKDTNNVSIHDVIEQIGIQGEPKPDGFLAMPFEIISLWTRDASNAPIEGSERISVITPSGNESIAAEVQLDLTKVERHRHRVKFGGLPIVEEGNYYFLVELKYGDTEWNEVAKLPLKVLFDTKSTEKISI